MSPGKAVGALQHMSYDTRHFFQMPFLALFGTVRSLGARSLHGMAQRYVTQNDYLCKPSTPCDRPAAGTLKPRDYARAFIRGPAFASNPDVEYVPPSPSPPPSSRTHLPAHTPMTRCGTITRACDWF